MCKINICEKCMYFDGMASQDNECACLISDYIQDAAKGCEFYNKDLSDKKIYANCKHYRLDRTSEETCPAKHRPYTMALCLACDEFVKEGRY